jgi:hypothetical protein
MDGNHVNPTRQSTTSGRRGVRVFANTKVAILDLMPISRRPRWAVRSMEQLDYAVRLIASTVVADHGCAHTSAGYDRDHDLATAERQLIKGDATFDQGNYAGAVDHYRSAWQQAVEDRGSRCRPPGIAVTPPPNLFILTKMVRGDKTSTPVTVKVTGTAANQVVFYARNLVTTTCAQNHLHCPAGVGKGSLARELKLNVFDTTTGLNVYSGKLKSLPYQPSFRIICGAGSTSPAGPNCHQPWAVAETHTFTFTVAFPVLGSGENAYQGTGVAVQLLWSRN